VKGGLPLKPKSEEKTWLGKSTAFYCFPSPMLKLVFGVIETTIAQNSYKNNKESTDLFKMASRYTCENEYFMDDDFGAILEALEADEEIENAAAVATETITLNEHVCSLCNKKYKTLNGH